MSVARLVLLFGLLFCVSTVPAPAWASDLDADENVVIDPDFEVLRPDGAGVTVLTLVSSQGTALRYEFEADEPIRISNDMLARAQAADGLYRWRATFHPQLDSAAREALAAHRSDPSIGTELPSLAPRSGTIRVVDGGFVSMIVPVEPLEGDGDQGGVRQVIAEDLIVQGSQCIGFDCPTTPSFGFDTLILRENNLRIFFDDSSNSASFPDNDWRLTANDSNNGGPEFFSIDDATADRRLLYLEAGSPANSIFLDSAGLIGFGTDQPAVELHSVDGDTPTLRLDQNGSSGFTPQTWDLAGNETNFFIRDVTNTSTLVFRIEPGAGTSSIHVENDSDVGFGLANPEAALHARRPAAYGGDWLRIDVPDDMDPATEERRMVLDNAGNLFVGGAINQLSSRYSKENLLAVAGDRILEQLSELPLWTWNYLTASDADRHIGPVAEDFYRTFGFGTSERSLSPSDVAGVALAASQALQQEIEERDQRIEELEARLARLEAALLSQENATDSER